MTTATMEMTWEVSGSAPHYRYDTILPLVQGRTSVEGVSFKLDDPMVNINFFENPKYKAGEFGLLDTNWGDTVAAIANGWDMVLVPIFVKRKPVYNYLWVRADRGIDKPKDLEGKTFATGGYGSAISTYTRGFLQDFYGVDLLRLS